MTNAGPHGDAQWAAFGTEPEERVYLEIDGIADPEARDGDVPNISRLAAGEGFSVVRLTFKEGQVLDDHKAGLPIFVQGISGSVLFETEHQQTVLELGRAVSVPAGMKHRLVGQTDGVVQLLILRG